MRYVQFIKITKIQKTYAELGRMLLRIGIRRLLSFRNYNINLSFLKLISQSATSRKTLARLFKQSASQIVQTILNSVSKQIVQADGGFFNSIMQIECICKYMKNNNFFRIENWEINTHSQDMFFHLIVGLKFYLFQAFIQSQMI